MQQIVGGWNEMSYVHVKKTSAYIHAAKMMEMVTSQFELTSKKPGGNLKKK